MNVPLLDLTAQYRSIRREVDETVARVIESQHFVMGPEVEGLEAEMERYLGVPRAIGVASGTDALLLPLRALGAQPGDEVIVPAFTFFATAGAVWNGGFKPAFCDVDPRTFNVTVETLEAARTKRTRAAVPVHLFGQMAPMVEITQWAEHHGITLVEDAAQSIGARQKGPEGLPVMAGASAPAAAFSFFPTKNLGAFGDGGMVTSRDPDLAEAVAKLRVHGGRQMYHHEMVGTNSRLDALQAAILRVKLRHLDAWTAARRVNACSYEGHFADLPELITPFVADGNTHVYNQYTIRTRRRDPLRAHLTECGIGTGIYYPVPLHLQACFAELGFSEGGLPASEQLCREVLSLPVFPELGADRLGQVAEAVRSFFRA